MNQEAGTLFSLSHQFRQHVRIQRNKDSCSTTSVVVISLLFSRGITLQAHRFTASLSSPRTVFPTSMSVSSMLNKSNLKTELPCDFGFKKKKKHYDKQEQQQQQCQQHNVFKATWQPMLSTSAHQRHPCFTRPKGTRLQSDRAQGF